MSANGGQKRGLMFGISEQPRWDHPFPRTGCNLDRHVEYIKADRRRRENNRVEIRAPSEPTNAGRANLQVLSKLSVSEGQLFRSRIKEGLPPIRQFVNPDVALTCFCAKVRTFHDIGQPDGKPSSLWSFSKARRSSTAVTAGGRGVYSQSPESPKKKLTVNSDYSRRETARSDREFSR